MKSNFLNQFKGFYWPLLFLSIFGGIYLAFFYEHGDWVLGFAEHFNPLVYQCFEYVTLIGEPQIIVPTILIIFLLNLGAGTMIFSSWILASLTTIILKSVINNHRPPYYFEDVFLQCSPNLEFFYNHSTPSGHTTAAFAFFAALALLSKYKWAQFFFFCSALLVGLSRVVLFVHFYYDIYSGAIIGSLTAFFVFWLFNEKNIFRFDQWKNKSILKPKL